MVSEDYLGLNDQLVLTVSHSKLLKSHLSFKYKCFKQNYNCEVLFSNYNEVIPLVAFETFGYI